MLLRHGPKSVIFAGKRKFGWIDFETGVFEPLKNFAQALWVFFGFARENDAIIPIRNCELPS